MQLYVINIDIFTGPLGDGPCKSPLGNGHTTFHLLKTECIDATARIGMTTQNTVMIIIRELHPTKLLMETFYKFPKQPIFQATNMTTLLKKPKYPIFQVTGMMIGDTILTRTKPLFHFLTMPFLAIRL